MTNLDQIFLDETLLKSCEITFFQVQADEPHMLSILFAVPCSEEYRRKIENLRSNKCFDFYTDDLNEQRYSIQVKKPMSAEKIGTAIAKDLREEGFFVTLVRKIVNRTEVVRTVVVDF